MAVIYELHGNQTLVINKQKRKNPNITLKKVSKSQGKKEKDKEMNRELQNNKKTQKVTK